MLLQNRLFRLQFSLYSAGTLTLIETEMHCTRLKQTAMKLNSAPLRCCLVRKFKSKITITFKVHSHIHSLWNIQILQFSCTCVCLDKGDRKRRQPTGRTCTEKTLKGRKIFQSFDIKYFILHVYNRNETTTVQYTLTYSHFSNF